MGNPSDEFRKMSEGLFEEIAGKYKGDITFAVCEGIKDFNSLVAVLSKGADFSMDLFIPDPYGTYIIPGYRKHSCVVYTCENGLHESELNDVFSGAAKDLSYTLQLSQNPKTIFI